MSEPPNENPQALLRRAHLLLDQGRHEEAAEWFLQVLAINPQDSYALSQLALCWAHNPAKRDKAMVAARQAVALAPDDSLAHTLLALTFLECAKPGQDGLVKEARDSAAKALELAPDSAFGHAVHGMALLRLSKYPEAEASARQALALNTDDTLAAQVLARALLSQRKDGDLQSLVDWQLAENPEEDSAHVSAGIQALRQGDHKKACEHFREALRINPGNEGAREGLMRSFRARSFIYRTYLKFSHFMLRFGQQGAKGVMLAGFLVYRFVFSILKTSHPGLAYTLVGLWLVFALWTFLARGLGSALMLTDRFVRMAVRPKERWEGACVGGMVLLALGCLGAGLWQQNLGLILAALACVMSAVPVGSAFSNDHHLGQWLDLAVAVVASGAALLFTGIVITNVPVGDPLLLFQTAVYSGVGTSWMRMLGIWTR